MSKRELNSLLATLLPYIHGKKQRTALFTVVLMLGMLGLHGPSDALHVHVESPVPEGPTVAVRLGASGTNININMTPVQPINVSVGP
jgi:hypothetical protein